MRILLSLLGLLCLSRAVLGQTLPPAPTSDYRPTSGNPTHPASDIPQDDDEPITGGNPDQNYEFPLTALDGYVLNYTTNNGVSWVQNGAGNFNNDVFGENVIYPNFGLYNQTNLKYSIEVYADIATIALAFQANNGVNPSNYVITTRICDTLSFPGFEYYYYGSESESSNPYYDFVPSYCAAPNNPNSVEYEEGAAFTTAGQIASFNPNTFDGSTTEFSGLGGYVNYGEFSDPSFIEIVVQTATDIYNPESNDEDDDWDVTIYVVAVLVNPTPGYDLLVMEGNSYYTFFPEYEGNNIYAFNGGDPAFIIQYVNSEAWGVEQNSTTVHAAFAAAYPSYVNDATLYYLDFYLAAQMGVDFLYVQECTGLPCDSCSNLVGVITTGGDIGGANADDPCDKSLTGVQCNSNNGTEGGLLGYLGKNSQSSFNIDAVPQSGRYYYPVYTVGDGQSWTNCVQFITSTTNTQVASAGSNTKTYSITLQYKNCYEHETCTSCLGDSDDDAYCGWCSLNPYSAQTDGTCEYSDGIYNYEAYSIYDISSYTSCVISTAILTTPRFLNEQSECSAIIRGDPRISGLQGQDFQVHGTPNEYFNLVTAKDLQINSRFVYLDDAKCDNFTDCFTHPGTYIDEIGVMMGENKIRLLASAIDQPMRVFINGKEVLSSSHKHSAGQVTVKFTSDRRAIVKTPEFSIKVSQSDKFFNVESALLNTALLDAGSKFVQESSNVASTPNTQLHGLIGQTWRNTVYAGDRLYEGEVPDYLVQDGLWGKDFKFNLYN